MYKSSSTGPFTIPTAPQAGVSIVSGAANVYTASYVALIASTAEAEYITGIQVSGVVVTPTYINVQLATGAIASETIIAQVQLAPCQIGTKCSAFAPIWPWIPVAASTRIAAKVATDITTLTILVTLQCMKQSLVVVDSNVKEQADVQTWLTTAVTAATAGIPDVNTKNINNVAAATPGASGGILISGSNSGTTTLGALTVTGATTHTGNMVLSDGLTISAPSTGNRAGLSITGNGTGAAALLTGGATGIGLSVVGGGTSGDGIKVVTTSGHGVNLAPVGSNVHGLFATGGNGGTSDGIKAAAGTGGVDLRANQTGNLTGNVSGSVGSVTGAVGSVTAGVTLAASAVQAIWDALTSALTTVGSIGKLLVTNIDAAISGRMATYTQPSGFLAATFPAGTVANTTNITAGTMTTTTNLTNAPTAGDFTAAMKTSLNAATPAVTVSDKTGFSLTAAYDAAKTAAPASDVTAIKAKTDSLTFTVANKLDVNLLVVNGVTVTGAGTAGNPWGPV